MSREAARNGAGDDVRAALALVVPQESARILATLIGQLGGDFGLAEEAFQEACATALVAWPRDGIPARPGAWLTTTARRKALDREREGRARRAREAALVHDDSEDERAAHADLRIESSVDDDLLRLVFTCAHPALAPEARVALTLRTLGGLTTAEIARAFLVSEETMAQRLTRAQRRILEAGIAYRVPTGAELPERLSSVLAVVYLVFNEGYSASSGAELVRVDLCALALRLARQLAGLMPREPEVLGLLALLLFQDSRRAARADAAGEFVPLEQQDRTRWDRAQIRDALEALRAARALGPPGAYMLQAAIAAEHAHAPEARLTDWARIVQLYDELLVLSPSPVVALNRVAALALSEGAAIGLAELACFEREAAGVLAQYHWLHALRAELLLRAGRSSEARTALREAQRLAGSETERRHLARRLAMLDSAGVG